MDPILFLNELIEQSNVTHVPLSTLIWYTCKNFDHITDTKAAFLAHLGKICAITNYSKLMINILRSELSIGHRYETTARRIFDISNFNHLIQSNGEWIFSFNVLTSLEQITPEFDEIPKFSLYFSNLLEEMIIDLQDLGFEAHHIVQDGFDFIMAKRVRQRFNENIYTIISNEINNVIQYDDEVILHISKVIQKIETRFSAELFAITNYENNSVNTHTVKRCNNELIQALQIASKK